MFKTIKQYLSLALYFSGFTIKRQMAYPMFLITFLVSIPIKAAAGVMFLYVLVERFQPLAGWTFEQLIFVYGLSYISEGLTWTFAAQAWRIDYYTTHGRFDRMLLRPLSILFQFIFRYVNLMGLLDLLTAGTIFLYGARQVGVDWSAANIFNAVIVILGATLIRIAFLTIIGSVAFWTKRSGPLVWVGAELLRRTTLYPLPIYPQLMQILFTFIIPLGFISYYPACAFFGYDTGFVLPLPLAFWTPLIGVAVFFLSNKVFSLGFKKYESAGT